MAETVQLPLVGKTVSSCIIKNWCLALELTPRETILRIEQTFDIVRNGDTFRVEYGQLEDLGRTAFLAGQTVTGGTVDEQGILHLEFSDGSLLRVLPHDRFEAWVMETYRGPIYVSVPGGKVVKFEDDSGSES